MNSSRANASKQYQVDFGASVLVRIWSYRKSSAESIPVLVNAGSSVTIRAHFHYRIVVCDCSFCSIRLIHASLAACYCFLEQIESMNCSSETIWDTSERAIAYGNLIIRGGMEMAANWDTILRRIVDLSYSTSEDDFHNNLSTINLPKSWSELRQRFSYAVWPTYWWQSLIPDDVKWCDVWLRLEI